MTLIEKQNFFLVSVARLIQQAQTMGYLVTAGEFYRPPEMAQIYAARGTGIVCSNHIIRLACDLNLMRGTEFLQSQSDYEPLGALWESWSTGEVQFCWGGRWGDADHFSFEHAGVK